MKRSTKKILTTHVGSLPDEGRGVEWVVRKQREVGLDLLNEGEYTKGGDWLSYVEARFGGFEPRPPPPGTVPLITRYATGCIANLTGTRAPPSAPPRTSR